MREVRMSFCTLCRAAYLLSKFKFNDNCSAIYRDLGYISQYLEDEIYIVKRESGSDISHIVKAKNPHEAIAKIAFDHAAENERIFNRRG